LSFLPGNLSIAKIAATVTANSASGSYTGLTQSVTGFTATGLVNNESASVLTGVTASGTGTDAGNYTSTASGSANNYVLSFLPGNLSIAKIAATVTANSASGSYTGLEQFITGFTATGLVNGETTAVLTGVTDTDGIGTNVGRYTNSASGSATNYILSFIDGALNITPAPATVTANSSSTVYTGAPQSVAGFSTTGLVNGEASADLTGVSASGATGTSVGTYTSIASGNAFNYTLSFVNGELVITPVVTNGATNAIDAATYGVLAQSDTGFFATSLMSGDRAPILSALTTTAVGTMNLGSYHSTITGFKIENSLSIVNGKAVIESIEE
jgi:hypothetical protein